MMHAPQSGAVTAVAVISFVVGGIVLVFGICGGIGVAMFTGQAGGFMAFNIPAFGSALGIAIGICVAIILWGIGVIVAGIGVINRSQWGRVLTLILGGIAALVALLFVWAGVHSLTEQGQFGGPPDVGGVLLLFLTGLILLGYTILAYIILLNPVYGSEFR